MQLKQDKVNNTETEHMPQGEYGLFRTMSNIEFVIFVTYTNRPELTCKHVIWKKTMKVFTLKKQLLTVIPIR